MTKLIRCKRCGAEMYKGMKKCPQCGKKNKGPVGFIILGIILLLVIIAIVVGMLKGDSKKKVEYTWPTSGVAKLLPEPDAKYGKILGNSEDYFSTELYNMTESDFLNYIEECKTNGFIIDYISLDSYYFADDENGNSLTITYKSSEKKMSIDLYGFKKKKEKITNETTEKSTVDSSTEESETETENSANTDTTGNTDDTAISDTSFREWVDEYESFINEYIEFMINYDETDVTQLAEYAKLMEEYAEFVEATDNLKENDYSADDWKYYMDAQTRITQKLLEIE